MLKVVWKFNMPLNVLLVDKHLLLMDLILLLIKFVLVQALNLLLVVYHQVVVVAQWSFLVQNLVLNWFTTAGVHLRYVDELDPRCWVKVSEEDELGGLYKNLGFHFFLL